MKIIFALASIFILALHVDSRSVENELVRTPHMDRRFLTSLNGRIVNGFPGELQGEFKKLKFNKKNKTYLKLIQKLKNLTKNLMKFEGI